MKLTTLQKVVISLPLQNKQGQDIQATLTRGRLESMAQPLFKRMRQAVDNACWGVRALFVPCVLLIAWSKPAFMLQDLC